MSRLPSIETTCAALNCVFQVSVLLSLIAMWKGLV